MFWVFLICGFREKEETVVTWSIIINAITFVKSGYN